jgi:hypothetical protein
LNICGELRPSRTRNQKNSGYQPYGPFNKESCSHFTPVIVAAFHPMIEGKHLQEGFTVNVFSIAGIYMPVEICCQAFF